MPFNIVRDDITRVQVDAIVNAANNRLMHGGGVCGAIFEAAGARRLQAACDEIGYCETGRAVATSGFDLPADYVIHTVGPVWQGGGAGERELLASCYRTTLELAATLKCRSIAFPLISSGIYGYPKREALAVAQGEIRAFLETHEMAITLVLFDRGAVELAEGLRMRVTRYIDDVYVGDYPSAEERRRKESFWQGMAASMPGAPAMAQRDAEAAGPYGMAPAEETPIAAEPNDQLQEMDLGDVDLQDTDLFDAPVAAACDAPATPEPDWSSSPTPAPGAPAMPGSGWSSSPTPAPGAPAMPGSGWSSSPTPAPGAPTTPEPDWPSGSASVLGAPAAASPDAAQAPAARPKPTSNPLVSRLPRPLRKLLNQVDAGFSDTLMALIDERGLKDADVYKRANLSRQHFSKIRSNPRYQPKKNTVLALAVALRLSLDETSMLLERAGFALSHADRRDIIVEFFIREGNYDVFEINDALFAFDQPLLG